MKSTCIFPFSLGLLLVAFAQTARGQTSFQNLDFESASLGPSPPGLNFVPISAALPGWTGYFGAGPATQVLQNDYTLGEASIDILGPNWPTTYGVGTIAGSFTVMIQAGGDPTNSSIGVNASIAQSGTIPANTESLQFQASELFGGNNFSVSFAGNSLSPILFSSGQSPSGQPYNVYGVDVSAFAVQTGQFEFTSIFNPSDPSLLLDNISFSPTPVPEPAVTALLVTGGFILGFNHWRVRR